MRARVIHVEDDLGVYADLKVAFQKDQEESGDIEWVVEQAVDASALEALLEVKAHLFESGGLALEILLLDVLFRGDPSGDHFGGLDTVLAELGKEYFLGDRIWGSVMLYTQHADDPTRPIYKGLVDRIKKYGIPTENVIAKMAGELAVVERARYLVLRATGCKVGTQRHSWVELEAGAFEQCEHCKTVLRYDACSEKWRLAARLSE